MCSHIGIIISYWIKNPNSKHSTVLFHSFLMVLKALPHKLSIDNIHLYLSCIICLINLCLDSNRCAYECPAIVPQLSPWWDPPPPSYTVLLCTFRFYFNCPHILLCDGNKHIIIIIISRAIQTVRVPAPPIAPMPTMDRELETFRKTNLQGKSRNFYPISFMRI